MQVSKKKKIGVIATQFTIGTEAHKRALLAADPAAEVYPLACPRFVPLIEGEQFDSAELQDAIAEYAAPLRKAGIDALLLGCTHFPFIREQLEAELGAGVKVIDPAAATSAKAIAELEAEGLLRTEGAGKVEVCCTADLARVERLAARMLPAQDCSFRLIELSKK